MQDRAKHAPAHASDVKGIAIEGVIFDVDGVLVDSPHERAWRESLEDLMATRWQANAVAPGRAPARLTTVLYQELVAGKPRLSGARAALDYFQVPDAERRAVEYAERKQKRLLELIGAGLFSAFQDGLRFVLTLKARGLKLAAASSSENANALMDRILLDTVVPETGPIHASIAAGTTLLQVFEANVCGRPVAQGKPHPDLFLLAAHELGLNPAVCLVVEDAPSGIQAARAGAMRALGVARLGDHALLNAAGADLVVPTLDLVSVDALIEGCLEPLHSTTGPGRGDGAQPFRY